jgi:hypothetical protein
MMAKLAYTLNSCDGPEDVVVGVDGTLRRFQYELPRAEKAGDLPSDRKPVELPAGFALKIRIPEENDA